LKPNKTEPLKLPDKRYFRIGEVSKIAGLPSHTLRFWETEFQNLRPQKAGTGQRIYQKADVEFILLIKKLLHEQKFTIEGAKKYLRERRSGVAQEEPAPAKTKAKIDGQLGFGFAEIKLKDKIKKAVDELKKIEKVLGSEL